MQMQSWFQDEFFSLDFLHCHGNIHKMHEIFCERNDEKFSEILPKYVRDIGIISRFLTSMYLWDVNHTCTVTFTSISSSSNVRKWCFYLQNKKNRTTVFPTQKQALTPWSCTQSPHSLQPTWVKIAYTLISWAIQSHKTHIFSVLRKAMKRILQQTSDLYDVYNKSYKVIKSHICHVRS